MHATRDAHLWAHVRRTVTPLGQPCPAPRAVRPLPAPRYDVDLHGDSVHGAYERVRDTVSRARHAGRGEIVVVTGRSGSIRVEFPDWAALNPEVRGCEPMNGGGAYRVRLRGAASR